eukprot:TRINITY_DN31771_c0_g1_i5.p1 TRINITY_DN31771_c0_g1~~TRINITY_DN31771_c0_g1_i5.p1  ORF type:complete len:166 (+),score=1.47 TRINITY_DN31771_c0_g1_i5:317-814(+)
MLFHGRKSRIMKQRKKVQQSASKRKHDNSLRPRWGHEQSQQLHLASYQWTLDLEVLCASGAATTRLEHTTDHTSQCLEGSFANELVPVVRCSLQALLDFLLKRGFRHITARETSQCSKRSDPLIYISATEESTVVFFLMMRCLSSSDPTARRATYIRLVRTKRAH